MVGQGLKPRRGGLFIANVHTSPLSFCFSAARLKQYRSAEAKTLPRSSLVQILQIRAAEKQKERGNVWTFAINRPPLRGLIPWPTMKFRSLLSAEPHRGCLARNISGK